MVNGKMFKLIVTQQRRGFGFFHNLGLGRLSVKKWRVDPAPIGGGHITAARGRERVFKTLWFRFWRVSRFLSKSYNLTASQTKRRPSTCGDFRQKQPMLQSPKRRVITGLLQFVMQ